MTLFGFSDSLYLTIRHFWQVPGVCVLGGDCNEVLASVYSTVAGVPLAVLGMIYYLFILLLFFYFLKSRQQVVLKTLIGLITAGILLYFYLIYLQIFIIKAICFYCILSAVASVVIGLCVFIMLKSDNLEKIFPKA